MATRIEIRGVIIPNDYQWIYDLFEIEATSPGKVMQAIADANGGELEVVINSGGGDVFSGSEIYTTLKDHPADVTVKITGVAASAASVIAMGGKKVMMSPTAQLMIHNASTVTVGDKREHWHSADFLHTVDASIANAYRLKTGLSQTELLNLMSKETWMNAQEALKKKFIDGIMFDDDDQLSAVAFTGSEMIPTKVIEKIRNEFGNLKLKGEGKMSENQMQMPQLQDSAVTSMPAQTYAPNRPAAQLPVPGQAPQVSQTPSAQQQTPQAAALKIDLAAQERARLKAIDEIAANIDPALVNEAKYGENPMTAEQLAFRAMKEGRMLNNGLFNAAVAANYAAGTGNVQAQTQTQGSE